MCKKLDIKDNNYKLISTSYTLTRIKLDIKVAYRKLDIKVTCRKLIITNYMVKIYI